MAQRYFITGTDTGVGKTVFSALLCAALDASYWKPIQTGAEEDSDSRTVRSLAGLSESKSLPRRINLRRRFRRIWLPGWRELGLIWRKYNCLRKRDNAPLIVEGAGGVLVPVNERELMVDLMRHVGLPVLLAARSSLGTINHTMLSLAALRNAGVAVAGVVMIGAPNAENRAAIQEYGNVRVVGEIPWLTEVNRAALLEIFAARFDQESYCSRLARATTQS